MFTLPLWPNPAPTSLQISKIIHKSNAVQILKEITIFHSQLRARRKTMIHSSTPSSIERRLPKSHSIPRMHAYVSLSPSHAMPMYFLSTHWVFNLCPHLPIYHLAPRPRKTNCQVNPCTIHPPPKPAGENETQRGEIYSEIKARSQMSYFLVWCDRQRSHKVN